MEICVTLWWAEELPDGCLEEAHGQFGLANAKRPRGNIRWLRFVQIARDRISIISINTSKTSQQGGETQYSTRRSKIHASGGI